MKPNFSAIESMRIYRDKTPFELLMKLLTWRICQTDFLVNNANRTLRLSGSLGLESVTNSLIKASLGKTFIGGSSIEETKQMARKINAKGIGVCYDFGCEGSSSATEQVDLFICC